MEAARARAQQHAHVTHATEKVSVNYGEILFAVSVEVAHRHRNCRFADREVPGYLKCACTCAQQHDHGIIDGVVVGHDEILFAVAVKIADGNAK